MKKKIINRINSSSEPNLITARKDNKSGFPPGITVDELWLYRRKRPSENLWPNDNLKLREGSFKCLRSEYRRRFKNFRSEENLREELEPVKSVKPEDHLILEGPYDFQPLYKENFVEYPIEKSSGYRPTTSSFKIIDSNENEMKENSRDNERLLSEIKSKYISYPITERPPLIKRKTNLKLEGNIYTTTEQAEQFIQYLLTNKPTLVKKHTTLKLEGEMDINTENREKYIPYDIVPRPPLCKKFTNLHLEGDLNITTEKQEQFVPYKVEKRPPLIKKQTNLVIEGEIDLLPEYRREFIEYKIERPKMSLPVNNLKTDGFYDVVSDVSPAFQRQIHPQIPNLRRSNELHEDMGLRTRTGRTRDNSFIKPEESKSAKIIEDLEKQIEGTPVRSSRSRRLPPKNQLKNEGKLELSPEYKCSYIDFPRKRPQIKKPENSLFSEGEMDHMTEKREKHVPFTNVPRTSPLKRDTELKLEGNIECQPEYRKAYIDYLIRERVERKPRPLDNLGQPRRIIENEPIQKTTLQPVVKEEVKRPKSTRNQSLNQIETTVFGPKLQVPEEKARSTTPKPISSRRRSRTLPRSQNLSSDTDDSSRKYKTFGKPILVENLASRSSTPVLPIIDVSAKNKWMRDSSVESSSAFVVLDKNVKRDKWSSWNDLYEY